MTSLKILLLWLLLLLADTSSFAKNITYNDVWWINPSKSGVLLNHYQLSYQLFDSYRTNFDNGHHYVQNLTIVGLSKALTSHISIGLAEGYFLNKTSTELQHERRDIEQIQFKYFDNKASTRFRAEQRHNPRHSGTVNWLRLLAGLDLPNVSHNVTPYISNEFFWLLNNETWLAEKGFDQNRFQFGLKIKQSSTKFALGYMNQFLQRDPRNLMSHNFVIGVSF